MRISRIFLIAAICILGVIISNFIPTEWKYLFGFIVGTVLQTILRLTE